MKVAQSAFLTFWIGSGFEWGTRIWMPIWISTSQCWLFKNKDNLWCRYLCACIIFRNECQGRAVSSAPSCRVKSNMLFRIKKEEYMICWHQECQFFACNVDCCIIPLRVVTTIKDSNKYSRALYILQRYLRLLRPRWFNILRWHLVCSCTQIVVVSLGTIGGRTTFTELLLYVLPYLGRKLLAESLLLQNQWLQTFS